MNNTHPVLAHHTHPVLAHLGTSDMLAVVTATLTAERAAWAAHLAQRASLADCTVLRIAEIDALLTTLAAE